MDKDTYYSSVYLGKHEKHDYLVCRQLSEKGKWEVVYATGKEELREACRNCFNTRVTDLTTGEEFPYE